MKALFILLLLFTKSAEHTDISSLRILYASAVNDESKAKLLIESTEQEKDNAILSGYCGAGKILISKHYSNPFVKYSSFNEGRKILEAAVYSDSSSAELRYLRLSIQKNVPSFLGYNKNIERDKLFLNRCLPAIKDKQLKSIIADYLKID